ncbi:MAG: hypothetical protein HYX89_00435 [Chloroflexi bacterium]|nr:hypothetical protein [Chloroflexota bacterium]
MRAFAMGCLAGIVFLVAIGAVVVYTVTRPPAEIAARPTIAVSTKAAKDLDNKLDQVLREVDEAKTKGERRQIEITLTEEEITSKIAEGLAEGALGGGPQPKDVQVHLEQDRLVATARVAVGGLEIPVAVNAKVTAEGGAPKITVESVDTGRLPLPGVVRDQINQLVGTTLDPSKMDLPVDVSAIQIANGQMTVAGMTK